MRRPDVTWGARGDEEAEEPERALVATTAGRAPRKPQERSMGETWGKRVCNRRPRGRSKSSALPVDRRRLGPGKATTCHDGVVEAVLAAFAESVENKRAPRKKRAPVSSGGCDRGVRGTITQASGTEENAPTIPARSAEAMRSDVKRSHPRLGGRQPIEATTGEEPDALDRERGRVRVLVV